MSLSDIPAQSIAPTGNNQYIIFTIENDLYGIHIHFVQKIIKFSPLKKLPYSPEFLAGIMNLAGNIIPVVNMRERFYLTKAEYNNLTRIIIINHRSRLAGIIVDEVIRKLEIPDENIEKNPDIPGNKVRDLVSGVARINSEVVILLDPDNVLISPEDLEITK